MACPVRPSTVAVIMAVPGEAPVTAPEEFTVATAELLLDQLAPRPVSSFPWASREIAVNWRDSASWTVPFVGSTRTASTAATTVVEELPSQA